MRSLPPSTRSVQRLSPKKGASDKNSRPARARVWLRHWNKARLTQQAIKNLRPLGCLGSNKRQQHTRSYSVSSFVSTSIPSSSFHYPFHFHFLLFHTPQVKISKPVHFSHKSLQDYTLLRSLTDFVEKTSLVPRLSLCQPGNEASA